MYLPPTCRPRGACRVGTAHRVPRPSTRELSKWGRCSRHITYAGVLSDRACPLLRRAHGSLQAHLDTTALSPVRPRARRTDERWLRSDRLGPRRHHRDGRGRGERLFRAAAHAADRELRGWGLLLFGRWCVDPLPAQLRSGVRRHRRTARAPRPPGLIRIDGTNARLDHMSTRMDARFEETNGNVAMLADASMTTSVATALRERRPKSARG